MKDLRERINSMVRQIAKHDQRAMDAKLIGREDIYKAHLHLASVLASQVEVLRKYYEEM